MNKFEKVYKAFCQKDDLLEALKDQNVEEMKKYFLSKKVYVKYFDFNGVITDVRYDDYEDSLEFTIDDEMSLGFYSLEFLED